MSETKETINELLQSLGLDNDYNNASLSLLEKASRVMCAT